MPDNPEKSKLADDLLWGISAIAAEINRSYSQTRQLIEKGALNGVAKLTHKTVVGSRQALHQQFRTPRKP
jgi:hypothetical protein